MPPVVDPVRLLALNTHWNSWAATMATTPKRPCRSARST